MTLSESVATSPLNFRLEGDELVVELARRDGSCSVKSLSTVRELPEGWLSADSLEAVADSFTLRANARRVASAAAEPLYTADLFSGCGGMSLGAEQACYLTNFAFRPSFVADVDRAALQVYARNFGIDVPEAIDLSGLSSLPHASYTPLEVRLRKSISRIDLVLAGPPCQGHSNLNNHTRRRDVKNDLYMKVARFALIFRPRYVVVENVPAVLRSSDQVVDRSAAALRGAGYFVSAGTVDLSRIGVPQTRKRHVLIAVRSDLGIEPPSVEYLHDAYATGERTVRWAIEDLLDVGSDLEYDQPSGMTEETRRRIDYLFDKDRFELPDEERPDCHRDREHTYPSVYGRMHWDRPAATITSGFVTMGRGRFVHPAARRTLTPHEAARLQMFPDSFDFSSVSGRNALATMIGNAVPPRLSFVICLELLR